MARLIPANTDLGLLEHSERRVVEALVARLDDGWYVVPSVPVQAGGRDYEIDVVLIHPRIGVVLVEVKGGLITMSEGRWQQYGRPMKNPVDQVMQATHALLTRLRKMRVDTRAFYLQHMVAFPDIQDFPAAGAGPDCPREMVLTKLELADPSPVFASLRPSHRLATPAEVASLIHALRPDITDIQVNGNDVMGVSSRLLLTSLDRLGPVIGLDENLRVYLRGAAGTGKTFVAQSWVKRAVARGERVLYLCFNNPLAAEMRHRLVENADVPDGAVAPTVGTFHKVILDLMGDAAPAVPADADSAWWDRTLPDFFAARLADIPDRFDTIVVDEAQDFPPHWLGIVEQLMVDPATSRLYLMADSRQAIYVSDWRPPSGITTLELTQNVRNPARVARVVARLGGAETPRAAAIGPEVELVTVGGMKECLKAVRRCIEHVRDVLQVPVSQILVVTSHSATRDAIIAGLDGDARLTRWEERNEDAAVCETIQRTKGLERPAVIVVDMDEKPDEALIYVGTSRSSGYLAVIGREVLVATVSRSNQADSVLP